jgi:hypothetical protein
MRKTALLTAGLLVTAGCVDGLGIQSSCSAEMAQVRSGHGGPPDATQRDEDRGDYSEVWYFDDSRRQYIFRWGVSYNECEVESGAFIVSPAPS